MEGKPPPPNPAMPYREDCWSEGATSTLIDAWGDRYVELNRGNLRQKHWQEVADVVNSRRGGERRRPRTDVQCKNRIDTLKKKYKVEKARILNSYGAAESQWPFYSRLEVLVGPTVTPTPTLTPSTAAANTVRQRPSSPPLALPHPYYRKGSPLPQAAAAAVATAVASAARPAKKRRVPLPAPSPAEESFVRRRYSPAAAAAAAAMEDVHEATDSGSLRSSTSSRGKSSKRLRTDDEAADGDGIRQLAHSIMRFGEIYEKVEQAKQKQMLELEKQRMEFAKRLEFQRMQIFVDSHIQLVKIRQSRQYDGGELVGSAVLPFLFEPSLQ